MNSLHRITRALVVLLALSATACTFDWRRTKDSSAEVRGELEVPPDLARPGGTETLPSTPPRPAAPAPAATPVAPAAGTATPAPAAAAAAAAETNGARVQLERDGALRWLVVRDEPLRVWQQLRDYFVRNEIKLEVDDATALRFETVWIDRPVEMGGGFLINLFEKLHSSGLRDKYRVRVEPGRQPGTAEVYVSHQGLELIVTESVGVNVMQTEWLPRAADPHAEAEMVGRLMTHLGGDGKQAQLTEPAATKDGERIQGNFRLAGEDLDSAWRRVGQALDRSGVIIEDRDRTTGVFYVQFKSTGGKKSSGLFGWLQSGKTLEEAGKEESVDRFQVALKAGEAGTVVSVLDVAGQPAESGPGNELLNLLHRQLR